MNALFKAFRVLLFVWIQWNHLENIIDEIISISTERSRCLTTTKYYCRNFATYTFHQLCTWVSQKLCDILVTRGTIRQLWALLRYLSRSLPNERIWHKPFFLRWVQAQASNPDTPGGYKNASGPVGIPLKGGCLRCQEG